MNRIGIPILLVVTFVISVCTGFTEQRMATIIFKGKAARIPLVEGKNYFSVAQQDSVSFDVCRFYISDVEIMSGEKPLGKLKVHLVDLFDSATSVVHIPIADGAITGLRFNLGIDSATNVAGVGSGDLDPTNGMYWSWQSGYINLKMEGRCKLCSSNRGEFTYHLGGYDGVNRSIQYVELNASDPDINVAVDVMRFISAIELKQTPRVMSPGIKAVELSQNAARMFYTLR